MCPSSGADDCVVLSPCVDVVPWLQEGCQKRLAGSVSLEEFIATDCLKKSSFSTIYKVCNKTDIYRCPRRNVPDFGRVFLMLKYTDITQNTYVQS